MVLGCIAILLVLLVGKSANKNKTTSSKLLETSTQGVLG